MKYVPSLFIGQLSKKEGSNVASRNRFGSYFRNRVMPVNPATPGQTVRRNDLAELAADWRGLTDAQRLAWIALGAQMTKLDSLGQTYSLTGQEAYVSINFNLKLFGIAKVSDAPAFASPSILDSLTLTVSRIAGVSTFSVAFTIAPLTGNQRLMLEATPMMSAGRKFISRSLYKIVDLGAANTTSPRNILAVYEAQHGTLVAGTRIGVRGRIMTSGGFMGEQLRADAIVAAA